MHSKWRSATAASNFVTANLPLTFPARYPLNPTTWSSSLRMPITWKPNDVAGSFGLLGAGTQNGLPESRTLGGGVSRNCGSFRRGQGHIQVPDVQQEDAKTRPTSGLFGLSCTVSCVTSADGAPRNAVHTTNRLPANGGNERLVVAASI